MQRIGRPRRGDEESSWKPEKQEGSKEETWRLLNDPSLEGQTAQYSYDSVTPAGVQPWSAMAEVAWEMADKTNLTLSYEIGTWEDEYDDNWTGNIVDNAGTLTAELSVSF